jgi:hypothetical protein
MYKLIECPNITKADWAWKIIETDLKHETKEVAYFREKDLAEAVCKLLNMALTLAMNDPSLSVESD